MNNSVDRYEVIISQLGVPYHTLRTFAPSPDAASQNVRRACDHMHFEGTTYDAVPLDDDFDEGMRFAVESMCALSPSFHERVREVACS